MKILLSFALIFAFVFNSFGSPLVFKVTKEVKKFTPEILATFDVAKYNRIKIAVISRSKKNLTSISISGLEDENFDIALDSEENLKGDYVKILELPPSKIRVQIIGEGTYSLYVWASQ